jgi:hypothetical protein
LDEGESGGGSGFYFRERLENEGLNLSVLRDPEYCLNGGSMFLKDRVNLNGK